jgi:hypothetical protein
MCQVRGNRESLRLEVQAMRDFSQLLTGAPVYSSISEHDLPALGN